MAKRPISSGQSKAIAAFQAASDQLVLKLMAFAESTKDQDKEQTFNELARRVAWQSAEVVRRADPTRYRGALKPISEREEALADMMVLMPKPRKMKLLAGDEMAQRPLMNHLCETMKETIEHHMRKRESVSYIKAVEELQHCLQGLTIFEQTRGR